MSLFRYLDDHIDEIIKEFSIPNDWGKKLKNLTWVPVYTEPPSSCRIAASSPPWPNQLHKYPLASPSQSISSDKIWKCSNSNRILKFDPKSETLIKLLGWDLPITGRCATLQLLSLIEMYNSYIQEQNNNRSFLEIYYKIVPMLYTILLTAMNEDQSEVEIWSRSLKGKPFIWINGLFVEPSRVSFTPLSSLNTEPFLFVAKGELLAYRPLFIYLGVKEAFGPIDLINLLKDLSLTSHNSPLSNEKIDMCVGIIKIVIRLLLNEDNNIDDKNINKNKILHDNNNDNDKGNIETKDNNENKIIKDNNNNNNNNNNETVDMINEFDEETKQKQKQNNLIQIVESMGDIYLPDRNGVLTISKNLSFDDAPWISSQLSRGIRFVHRQIDNETAYILGAKSLREQLFSGDSIVCPDFRTIQNIIGNDTIEDAIGDLVGLADKLGATAVHILLDDRMHPTESLIHPGLTSTQGISISVFIQGIILNAESISQLFTSPVTLPNFQSSLKLDNSLNDQNGTEFVYNSVGKRLFSAFAITDCLQILSGNELCVFDPCGQYLIGAGEEQKNGNSRQKNGIKNNMNLKQQHKSKAQRYTITGRDNQSLLTKFPDQFKSLTCISFDGSGNQRNTFQGTLLRMPLRKEVSLISKNVVTLENLEPIFSSLIGRTEGSLIFGLYLELISIQHWKENNLTSDLFYEYHKISLLNHQETHYIRRKIIGDSSWKKSTSLFSWNAPVLTVEASYRAMIQHQYKINNDNMDTWLWNHEDKTSSPKIEWIVKCLQGSEAARSFAKRDPFKRLELQPFVSIAAPIIPPNKIREALQYQDIHNFSRYIYCNGGNLGGKSSGLPFHIDGSFVMNMSIRGLSLSDTTNDTRSSTNITQIIPIDLIYQWNSILLLGIVETLAPTLLLEIRNEIKRLSSTGISRKEDLKTFYIYWPYTPRIFPPLSACICRSKFFQTLASMEFFLGQKGFDELSKLVLPTCSFPSLTCQYLELCLPFADIPPQIAKDLLLLQINTKTLTPSMLREKLKFDNRNHCEKLYGKYEIVLPLLSYCLSDIERNSTDRDTVRRRTYKELAGCPLLFTADRNVVCFPTNPRDQVIMAPLTIHAILTNLRSILLHPILTRDIDILRNNSVFKESLFIEELSSQFIKDNFKYILPLNWERCQAIDWSVFLNINYESNIVPERNSSNQYSNLNLLLYILWKEIFVNFRDEDFALISNIPLLPVISGEKRILITTLLASHLLYTSEITAQQEDERGYYRRESNRLTLLVEHDIQILSEKIQTQSNEAGLYDSLSRGEFEYLTKSNKNDNSNDSKESSTTNNTPSTNTTATPTTTTTTNLIQNFDPFSSKTLGDVLKLVGLPIIDNGMFEGIPNFLLSSSQFGNGNRTYLLGHKILKCLSLIESEHIIIHTSSNNCELLNSESLLRFHLLNENHRKILLREILNAHQQRRLDLTEINQLKTLPLFTSIDGNMVTISLCNGIYWSESADAIASLSQSITGEFSNDNPTVLIYDRDLCEIYNLVGAEELTPLTVVKKFTLPSLSRMEGIDRLRIISTLLNQWNIYHSDTQIIQQLKQIPFIPSYRNTNENSFEETKNNENYDLSKPFRKADQLFSWTNHDLLNALSGLQQNEYFAPPNLRNSQWHALMTDLGMSQELDKESLIRIATDIQKTANNFRVDQNEAGLSEFGGPMDRGKALLRYIKDNDRAISLFDSNLARRLGKISFVPVLLPIGVESGGFVNYKPEICRFEQTLAANKGSLGFTCLPVVPEDLSPPQTFFSALGITSSPSTDVVLRHLRNLTTSGETLDRWNTNQYPIKETFGEIFTYLDDNWKSISSTIQNAFPTTNIIPINNSIYKPRRLFFRLSEDLSPFMHEIPRYYGSHEQFLKKIGVREKPSSEDYCEFLAELSTECKQSGLNPNELRAVIAIIESINSEKEAEGISSLNQQSKKLYLPDEDSILRDSSTCLYNDNGWLRGRLGTSGFNGFFILHPYLPKSIALNLNIPLLSNILVEELSSNVSSESSSNSHRNLNETFQNAIKSPEFIKMLRSLCLRNESKMDSNERHLKKLGSQFMSWDIETEINWKLDHIQIRFIDTLFTTMKLNNLNQKGTIIQLTESVQTLSFVDYNEQSQLYTLYSNSSMLFPPITPSVAVSIGICKIFDLDPSIAASISLLIDSIDQGDTNRIFTDLRVASDEITLRERMRGFPGAEVTESDCKMTELKPYRIYRLGEIVAYSKNENSNKLYYARVIAISDEGEAGLRRISIKTDSGIETYLPTELYSFKSARELSNQIKNSTVIGTDNKLFSLLYGSKKDSKVENKNETKGNLNQQSNEISESPINKNEIVNALQGLLLRAGIPISLENQDLVSKIMELESEKKKLDSMLHSERSQLNEAQETIQKTKSTYSCQICLSSPITHVMIPCGHTICGECLGRMQTNKCPFCRSNITQRVKLFFSAEEQNDDLTL